MSKATFGSAVAMTWVSRGRRLMQAALSPGRARYLLPPSILATCMLMVACSAWSDSSLEESSEDTTEALTASFVLPVGRGRVYKGTGAAGSTQIYVVSRINSSTLTFVTWDFTGRNWIGNWASRADNNAKIWRRGWRTGRII